MKKYIKKKYLIEEKLAKGDFQNGTFEKRKKTQEVREITNQEAFALANDFGVSKDVLDIVGLKLDEKVLIEAMNSLDLK